MKKQVIRMTQNGLQRLISESVRRILKEAEKPYGITGYNYKGEPKKGHERKRGDYEPIETPLTTTDYGQPHLGVKYKGYKVPGVENREHTNLNDCTETIRRIYTIKDDSKREMALQYLYMDLKDDALRYGKRIYEAVCARYITYDMFDEAELESFLLKMLNMCLGIEKGESGTAIAFNPNMEDVSFKTYFAQKIAGNLRNIIDEKKKRTFYKITKYEADKMMLKRLPKREFNKIVDDIRSRYEIKELKPGTYDSLEDMEYTTNGIVTNDNHGEMMKEANRLAIEKAWELNPDNTFNSFAEIQTRQIPDIFRVKKSGTPEKDDRFIINKSDDLDDPTKGKYNYYTTISKKPSMDTDSLDDLSKTLGNDLSMSSEPEYGEKTLGIKKQGKSERQYASEAINRIVRKVLTEMRKK